MKITKEFLTKCTNNRGHMNTEVQKQYEAEVEELLTQMQEGHKVIMYLYLNRAGYTLAGLSQKRDEIKNFISCKKETNNSSIC